MLVFRAERVSGAGHSGIFPVNVEAVEIVAGEECMTLSSKTAAALAGERHVGEIAGPEPSANGDQHGEVRVLLRRERKRAKFSASAGEPATMRPSWILAKA